ncbi:MAG: prepilin peptidase [Candidatus Cloacimonetes bacterium]|nr:prepilin peptidase [Candidatus Cloacimonadota bacterium]MBL7085519.1 prepilin peptidase [Candidatus Cloacimonadota bacterium]
MSEQIIIYLFIFILGAIFSSFFNVCIYRIPKKESIIFPASYCPNCGKKISPLHNVPILSYIFLKGRCKECGEHINWHYIFVEILTPILFIILFLRFGNSFSFTFGKYILFFSVGLIIFFIDLFHKIIPNILSIPLIPIGILLSFSSLNDVSFQSSLAGAIFGFVVFLLIGFFYKLITKRESLGGGDIKLIAAIGSFIGLYGIIFTIFISSFIAILVLFIVKHNRRKEFPFGPFLIIGSFVYVIIGKYLINWYLLMFGL